MNDLLTDLTVMCCVCVCLLFYLHWAPWKVVLRTKWSTSIIIQYNTIQYIQWSEMGEGAGLEGEGGGGGLNGGVGRRVRMSECLCLEWCPLIGPE